MARSKHPTHLYRRGDNYYFCCRTPDSQKLLRASLRTGDKVVATNLAAQLAALTKQRFITCSAQLILHINSHIMGATNRPSRETYQIEVSTPHQSSVAIPKVKLEPLIAKFVEEAARLESWQSKHQKDMGNALNVFLEIIGNLPVDEFDLDKALNYRDRLTRYPYKRSDTKRFQGKSLQQISRMQHKTISLTTVSNHIRKVNTFCNWLVENGYLPKNPLLKVKVKKLQSAKEAVRPFTEAELDKLFQSDIYTQGRYSLSYHYWLPLLGYYTGARIEELCQLHIDDLLKIDGHHCIRIDDIHDDQRLKTPSSRRLIPIHPHLIDLGLLQFAQERRLVYGEVRLFQDLNKIGGIGGQYSHAASKWFGRYRRRIGADDDKTVFHSFRHGFIDHLREQNVDSYVIKMLAGHAGKGTTEAVYGRQSPITLTARAISQIPQLKLIR